MRMRRHRRPSRSGGGHARDPPHVSQQSVTTTARASTRSRSSARRQPPCRPPFRRRWLRPGANHGGNHRSYDGPDLGRPERSARRLSSTQAAATGHRGADRRHAHARIDAGGRARMGRPGTSLCPQERRTPRSAGLKATGRPITRQRSRPCSTRFTAGSTIYFPKGTYTDQRADQDHQTRDALRRVGHGLQLPGRDQHVFNINKAGSATATMSGVTITGLVIEGPGIETTPAMIDGRYLQNFHVSYVKIHNVGYAGDPHATPVPTCSSTTVTSTTSSRTGYGYSVCDRRPLRPRHHPGQLLRHQGTAQCHDRHKPTHRRRQLDYARQIIFENNYCENTMSFGSAADTHAETIGPFIVRNNVFNNCQHGVRLRGGYGEIYDNVVIGKASHAGRYLRLRPGHSPQQLRHPAEQDRTQYHPRYPRRRHPLCQQQRPLSETTSSPGPASTASMSMADIIPQPSFASSETSSRDIPRPSRCPMPEAMFSR